MDSIAKLKWRCRRGMLELDLLLINYLENAYLTADNDEKNQFIRLIGLEDSQLQAYLIENQRPPSEEVYALVKKIRVERNPLKYY